MHKAGFCEFWHLNQYFKQKDQRNWLKQGLMVKFWIVINCISVNWTKKLTFEELFVHRMFSRKTDCEFRCLSKQFFCYKIRENEEFEMGFFVKVFGELKFSLKNPFIPNINWQ